MDKKIFNKFVLRVVETMVYYNKSINITSSNTLNTVRLIIKDSKIYIRTKYIDGKVGYKELNYAQFLTVLLDKRDIKGRDISPIAKFSKKVYFEKFDYDYSMIFKLFSDTFDSIDKDVSDDEYDKQFIKFYLDKYGRVPSEYYFGINSILSKLIKSYVNVALNKDYNDDYISLFKNSTSELKFIYNIESYIAKCSELLPDDLKYDTYANLMLQSAYLSDNPYCDEVNDDLVKINNNVVKCLEKRQLS